ncbi:MAG TPA: SDR family NAD(P)-dependent oxidoreductase [Candidatus Sumerlaeota bacterium]|nr:SDR family NAD(P)-dependent oxidoreductase [Candidatus Sumerlaeota bacterium]
MLNPSAALDHPLANLVGVARGALAVATGDEDRPWQPPVMRRRGGMVMSPLILAAGLAGEAEAAARARIAEALAAFIQSKNMRPRAVQIGEQAVYEIEDVPATAAAPLAGRVALVTGAAGAIGHGLCRGLLEKGCRVAATDLPGDALTATVESFGREFQDNIIGIPMDVTAPEGVRAAFAALALAWGGVDLVIVNAGIAHVAGLDELQLADFQRLERVNVEGTLNTLAEAGRWLKRQGIGGDVILISTKNVFAPGARFGAYSATKAAAHQLARIAALELAEHDIRVNMVAPDAVFSAGEVRSGLWATVGPDRMKARGLDEAGLEEYYRSRNLLKARVTARHVANAVLFFATRQTPTTGATLPVDGGLPDAAPR